MWRWISDAGRVVKRFFESHSVLPHNHPRESARNNQNRGQRKRQGRKPATEKDRMTFHGPLTGV